MSLQPSVPPAAVPMPKRTLYPVPSPIASPRPGHMWPGSPSNYAVPSIPPMSVPSPKHGASGIRTGRGGWECELTLEQFKQLLTPPTTPPTNLDGYPDDCSPLEVFLGSLSFLYQFANHVSKFQAGQQTSVPVSEIPYSRKYWRELNLAVEPKIAIARILTDLNLAVRYGIAIRIYASRKFWWILIWRL